jgi:hypothetical protein
MVVVMGCAGGSRERALVSPRTLAAPYGTSTGEVLWAVVPLRNESGTTLAESLPLSDKLVGAIEEVRGLRCLPINRTLAAMEALKMDRVSSPGEARELAQALGVDGIVAGSITAYDPYTPMMGLSLALYARLGALADGTGSLDIRALQTATRDESPTAVEANWSQRPLAVFSERLDAKNHATLMDVRNFGEGRDRNPSALGWRRYTASMDLYSEFVMFKGVDGLLQQEWTRLARVQMPVSSEQ